MMKLSVTKPSVTLAAALACAGAALLVGAPAHADVGSITVAPPSGGSYASSCTYRVTGTATGNSPVSLQQRVPGAGEFTPVGAGALPVNGQVGFSWTPAAAGHYTLKLVQGSTSATEDVDVVNGLNLGSLCMAI